MSELNKSTGSVSALRHRVHLYVNPYTHDYEITDIPTKYQVQHIGCYVGSFFSFYPLSRRDVLHCTSYKIIDQAALDKRYGGDGKRTNICFTCNKTGHWARNCPDKEKQTWTIVFVYVNPYTHEMEILPTWRNKHQFQNMIYVGVLKSFCNKYKINSPQNTKSAESQSEQSKQDDCEKMQNDSSEIKSSQSTILLESQDEELKNMQNNNTSITDSEICETAERLERLAKSLNIPNLNQYRSLFKPKENQINNHQQKDLTSSEEKDSEKQDNKKQDSKKQDSEKQDSEKQDSKKQDSKKRDSKKKNCYFCKSKKHEDKICPTIVKKKPRGEKRKSDGDSDVPNKKRKLSKIL